MTKLTHALDGYGEAIRRLQAVAPRLTEAAQAALTSPGGMASLTGPMGPGLTFQASDRATRLLAGLRAAVAYAEQVEMEFLEMATEPTQTEPPAPVDEAQPLAGAA